MAKAKKQPLPRHEMKTILAAYAGFRLRELRGTEDPDAPEEKKRTFEAIAEELGISKPQVFNLIHLSKGYGPKVERALADRFFDSSVDRLHDAARDWYVANATAAYVDEERYVAMPAVRQMARAQGFDEKFVKSWDVQLDADDQPDADHLWTLCKADYARWKRKTTPSGDPLADLDGAPLRSSRKKR